jgi:hypothetical protein
LSVSLRKSWPSKRRAEDTRVSKKYHPPLNDLRREEELVHKKAIV